jgi:hypothetical protein
MTDDEMFDEYQSIIRDLEAHSARWVDTGLRKRAAECKRLRKRLRQLGEYLRSVEIEVRSVWETIVKDVAA